MRRTMGGGRYDEMQALGKEIQVDVIQDLDRELELLRLKRQLIEEKQRQFQPSQYQQPQTFSRRHVISPWEQQPQLRSNDFNQPRTSYNQNEFSYSYNSGQSNSGNGFDSGPRDRKRQRWQDESAGPKRFRDNRSNIGGNFNPPKKFAPRPFQGVGGSQARGPHQYKPDHKPFNKKPFARPTKPLPSAAPADLAKEKFEDKQAFLEHFTNDEYPKKDQIRIQFASKRIYKNLMNRLDEGSQAHTLYRHIKSIIYARIRKVLADKPVTCQDGVYNIIEQYDAAFPSSTDDELVEQAAVKKAETLKSIQPSLDKPESHNPDESRKTAEGPDDYFRKNITEIMQKKLTEMMNKLKLTYKNEYNLQAQCGDNVKADKTTGDPDTSAPAASTDTETVPKSNNDEEAKSRDAENAVTDENKPADEEKAATDAPENIEGDNATKAESKTNEGDNAEDAKNVAVENENSNVPKNSSRGTINVDNYHVSQVDELIKREMVRLLTGVTDDLVAIMNMDKEFVNAKLTIAENADKMRLNPVNTPLHYVVLAGIPNLPEKAKFATFLSRFHPNAIKKHRTVRNVLFIGFANPQDQANILKANNTIFENAKLSIKETRNIGNAADTKKEKTATEKNNLTEEVVQEHDDSLQADRDEDSFQNEAEPMQEAKESSDQVIDSDLDGQINDLLESINNSETNPDDASGDVEMIDNDENNALNDGAEAQGDDADENQDGKDEMIDNEENDALNDGEEAQGDDADENQDGNGDQIISLDDEQVGERNGDAVPVEDANGEEKPTEENKDDKTQAIGDEGTVKDKKATVSTPKRVSTRVAAAAVQTRRSSRLPN